MNPSPFKRTQIAVATALLLATTASLAADVEVKSPPGGNFVVKDSAGTLRLQVQGAGPVTIPNLLTAPQLNRPLCQTSCRISSRRIHRQGSKPNATHYLLNRA